MKDHLAKNMGIEQLKLYNTLTRKKEEGIAAQCTLLLKKII